MPKVRTAIQASGAPASVLADRFGTTEQTVYKWRNHDGVDDGSHTPHRLQTILTPTREAVAAVLHRTLLVSLEDVSAIVPDFLNPNASHRGLDQFLRWHGVGNPPDLKTKAPQPEPGAFKTYDPERVHIDAKYLPKVADEPSRCYLLVAINRATRWVFIRALKAKTGRNARRFLRDLKRADTMRVRTILPDNGKEVADRLFGLRKRAATGEHDFDTLCAEFGIEYRPTPPRSLQTNGLAERFNGREKDVLQGSRFRSCGELEMTLHRYVWLYNQQVSQSGLGRNTPLQAMREWHKIKSEMLTKRQYYLPGCES